jgi:hypothetical protein
VRALLLIACASAAFAADRYQVTLRLPPGGLYAREETQIEFRVEDTTRPDPLVGFAPVIRAAPEATIDMPEMPKMPKFVETAHPEGVPGEYGIHPTFAHGGEFRLRVSIHPPGGESFEKVFRLTVQDPDPKRKSVPPRFTLELTTDPKRPKAGEPVDLRLIVRDRESGDAVSSFEIVHEMPMHLIVVRKDLTQFAHEHPEWDGGAFHLRHTFPAGGEYRLFADLAPRGAGGQVLMAKLKVGGPETRGIGDSADDPGVAMETAEILTARKSVPIEFRIEDAHGLQPYLGAAGHLILIHEDAESFVHSHPTEETASGGRLRFAARLPKPGMYRGWLQFQRDGKVLTHPFEVRAGE